MDPSAGPRGDPPSTDGAPPKHRSRRPRRAALGQLAQLDASPFAWFEDCGPMATLHGLIDDATSEPLALWFRPNEDLHGYVTSLDRTCRTYGLPVGLYGDRLNVFARNDPHWTLAEELQGHQDPTHFGRMLQALGIGFSRAHSPQAKGRIERLCGTPQDRLTSELRLQDISYLDTPQTPHPPRPAKTSSGRHNSPAHPWNQTVSRRQRALHAARATEGNILVEQRQGDAGSPCPTAARKPPSRPSG